ncbi:MAG: glutamate-1-semialdehyde 2,1-aminomutase [Candidatus Zixiibacteriota bacterium]|nr:MAG: glutamate-1-semialdehyde 2,1-aminomutase [candidate division Zixibacteria bacterium]
MTESEKLFREAYKILPGGVNSPVRAFKAVSGTPPFIVSAKGCILTDADGKEYIDYIGSWGPMILGHARPEIIKALTEAVRRGTSYGTPCPAEVDLAQEIVNRVPSIEKIRFVNSGTEATMSAIRLARAATGKDIIVKFAGGYHGHGDSFLILAGSGATTLGIPTSPGVTKGVAGDTRVLRYNDPEAVKNLFGIEGQKIAAVIVEPVAGNMGVVPPEPGFLEGLREKCNHYESILIFDEVMTGFRVAKAGAQQLYGVTPDLTAFGKVIGGGLPVGAYGGRADLMSMIAPEGPVYQAGTLSGNPLAMVAGLETLKLLNDSVYRGLEKTSKTLEIGLKNAADGAGIPVAVQRVGSMITVFFTNRPVKNLDEASAADHSRFAKFFNFMLKNGIHLPPSGYEAWFVSAAHDETVIRKTVDIAAKAFESLK